MLPSSDRPFALLVVASLAAATSLAVPAPLRAEAPADRPVALETPTAKDVEERLPAGAHLTGRELYDRFLKNRRRMRTVRQEGRILSSDPAGNPQEARFWLYWKDYRDAQDDPVNGVYSKTLVKFTGPREMRHTGYLYVHRSDRDDEQYMYSPNRDRTQQVRIVGQNVAGSDFSIDDFMIGLDDIEDADYQRHPDEPVQGISCYVVEANMKPSATSSQYARSITYLEKDHYVPLRTRYWDKARVEIKEATSPAKSIREFDGVWVPTEVTATDLLERTHSTLVIETLDPNPALDETALSLASLAAHP